MNVATRMLLFRIHQLDQLLSQFFGGFDQQKLIKHLFDFLVIVGQAYEILYGDTKNEHKENAQDKSHSP